MTKKEIITKIADEAWIPKVQAEKIFNKLVENMTTELSKGGKITLFGFGSFSIRDRKGRIGRNPRNGEPITIPPKKVVVFRPSSKLTSQLG